MAKFKLYFKYGAMGCSKSAQALMCRFNYLQKGFKVLLIKPSIDNRDKKDDKIVVKSRIGLSAECIAFDKNDSLTNLYLQNKNNCDVIIMDECQFATAKQIEELRDLTEFVPVLCYGLKTNFKTELFEGSKRLIELADSITELKSICKCGKKAIINARLINGKVATDGDEILIGGDERYEAMCYSCFKKAKGEN